MKFWAGAFFLARAHDYGVTSWEGKGHERLKSLSGVFGMGH